MFKKCVFGVAGLLALQMSGFAILLDFGPGLTNFSEVARTTGTDYLILPTGGLGGSNGAGVPLADDTLVYTAQSFDLDSGSTFTASAFFLMGASLSSGNITMELGLTASPTTGFYASGTGAGAYMAAKITTEGLIVVSERMGSESRLADGTLAQNTSDSSDFTLTALRWYEFSATWTVSGSNITMTSKVTDYGLLGTGSPVVIDTYTAPAFANASILSDSTLYGAFRARSNGGATVIDNIHLIPEPSSLALLSGGLAGFLFCRKRSVSTQ